MQKENTKSFIKVEPNLIEIKEVSEPNSMSPSG